MPLEDLIEAGALHVFHDNARPGGVAEGGVDVFDGVRMLEPSHELHFPLELLPEMGPARDLLAHLLDDDLPRHPPVVGEPNLAHTAMTDRRNHFVAVENGAPEHVRPLRLVQTMGLPFSN